MALSIGDLAARAGSNAPTIRYYEEIGLLPRPERGGNGRRQYAAADVERLLFIRRCRDFGFSVEDVRTLGANLASPEAPCAQARDVAARQLSEVRRKLSELKLLERRLATMVVDCDSACAGGSGADCSIGLAISRRS